MILWLPYPGFRESAKAMDSHTLTTQRFEAYRLLEMLRGTIPGPMINTPGIKMWRNYPSWVAAFGMALCLEWQEKSGRESQLTDTFNRYLDVTDLTDPYPRWMGDSVLHSSHRSNMIRLAPAHYQKLWPGVIEGLPLLWPNDEEDVAWNQSN